MIARIWRGRTPAAKADDYFEVLEATGLAEYAETPGYRGLRVLRRIDGEIAEFLIMTLWDSMEAIHAFAGPDPDRSVYYPEDDAYLLEKEPTVAHFEVIVDR